MTAARSGPEGGGGEIFVVDDNPENLGVLTTILREAGHVVRVANSGRRALAAVQRRPPELILLDVNMPDLDGHAVCARLKADPRTAGIPVVFLSALDDPVEKVSALRAGGADYVTKPFHLEEVLARVEGQLRLARLRALLEERNRELSSTNAELLAWKSQADRIFATLAEVLAGTTLDGRYLVREKIGMGGSAIVYEGVQLASGRPVAVKVLRPQPGEDERQQRARRLLVEGLSAIRVEHASAVAVLDSGVTEAGVAYLVMELLRGRSLSAELAEAGPLAVARAVRIFVPVCEALCAAHAAGVVHRDVKPSNVFLHRGEDAREVVKVVDFGIASLAETTGLDPSTTLGHFAGTPAYMSPERFLGQEASGSADVYGVAMTLYEAVAGRLPFAFPAGASLAAIVVRCLNEAPLPLRLVRPDVPGELDALVSRGLEKQPSRRPAMAELLAGLEALRAGEARTP